MPVFKISRSKYVLLAMMVVIALPSFARLPVRQTSDNGSGNSPDGWALLGRTVAIPLSANGKSVKATRQIICPNQDRLNGACVNSVDGSGEYIFLFQIQSTSTNVNINIGKLQGFVKDDVNKTYGVMICNDGNDQELCTTDPGDPDFNNISGITFTVKNKTSVTFTVPAFFNFPAGTTPAEGQGLTLFIKTKQNAAQPIAYPSLGVN